MVVIISHLDFGFDPRCHYSHLAGAAYAGTFTAGDYPMISVALADALTVNIFVVRGEGAHFIAPAQATACCRVGDVIARRACYRLFRRLFVFRLHFFRCRTFLTSVPPKCFLFRGRYFHPLSPDVQLDNLTACANVLFALSSIFFVSFRLVGIGFPAGARFISARIGRVGVGGVGIIFPLAVFTLIPPSAQTFATVGVFNLAFNAGFSRGVRMLFAFFVIVRLSAHHFTFVLPSAFVI